MVNHVFMNSMALCRGGLSYWNMLVLVPLRFSEGNCNAAANKDILDNQGLLTLWQKFGEEPCVVVIVTFA